MKIIFPFFIFFYLLFASLYNKKYNSIKVNKDLVDKLIVSKKETTKQKVYSKEDIEFLKKYNLYLNSENLDSFFVLNISSAKDIKSLMELIEYIEAKGSKAVYYKFNTIYYVSVGYFKDFEEAIKAKDKFKEFKNVYPVGFNV